ncbi:DUF4381 domain-containing protein [Pseudoalteromonas sp. SS15]|uniref:DUF4381 domain-containing protein n=1 Tax=Pseudoalteromonas sp. SS15 TaxID=3139393 RepID=UPI003BABFCBA
MQASPLDALHDVLPPEQVAWWPLSLPTWAVIITSLILLITLGMWLYKRQQFLKAKKAAIELAKQQSDDAQQLHIILKRLVKHYYGAPLTSLPTKKWQSILNTLSGEQFSEQALHSLYGPENNPELAKQLFNAIKNLKLKEAIDV